MSRLTVGSIEGLSENSNVISVPTGHSLNVADAGGLQIGGSAVVSAGLVHISRTTIGSAVSSVTVSGAFSADYDNYKILVSGGTASTNGAMQMTLGATVTGYAYQQIYGNYGGTLAGAGNSGTGTAMQYVGLAWTTAVSADVDLNSPFLTTRTFYRTYQPFTTTIGWVAGYLNNATSYTDFTLGPNAGTITGGTIDVYGYAKA